MKFFAGCISCHFEYNKFHLQYNDLRRHSAKDLGSASIDAGKAPAKAAHLISITKNLGHHIC